MTASHLNQWTAIEGAPSTFTQTVDHITANNWHFGGYTLQDRAGFLRSFHYALSAGRIFSLAKAGQLSVSTRVGWLRQNLHPDWGPGNAPISDHWMSSFPQNKIRADVGVWYRLGGFYTGLSVKYMPVLSNASAPIHFVSGYTFHLRDWSLEPIVQARVYGPRLHYRLTTYLGFRDTYYIGTSHWNGGGAPRILARVCVRNRLNILAGYDFQDVLGTPTGGSWELGLTYSVDTK